MKRANVKQHEAFDAAQTRLRLLISTLETEPADDDLESLDFTGTSPEPENDDDTTHTDTEESAKS